MPLHYKQLPQLQCTLSVRCVEYKVWESLGAVKGKGGVEEMQRGGSLDKKQFYTKEETPLYEITLE